MAEVAVSMPTNLMAPPPYERATSQSSVSERSRHKRCSENGPDELRPTLPVDALTGPLTLVLDLPEAAVLQHVEENMRPLISGRIEEIARFSAEEDSVYSVTEKLSTLGKEPLRDDEPSSPPPLHTPPSLPSFGMGLKRQKSFGCPATHLTDAEVKVQRELHARCAAALGRLASRFRLSGRMSGALSMARSRSGSHAGEVGVRESLS